MHALDKYAVDFNPKVAEALKSAATAPGHFPAHLGIEVEDAVPGRIVCTLAVRPEHLTPVVGVVHGGVLAALVDHTLSIAVYPLVEVGKWVATVEFKINYLGSVREGVLRATGSVERLGKRVAVVRVEVENDGAPVALAQGTLYVRDQPGA
ncbi:MAG: PaaI family thioesterase [Deltaproteobacteria bacterium]|nr:PaaI family thioesterase [Deltaproteobacteria bacterium]